MLQITCSFDHDKPDWMDGGTRQAEMAARLKREIKAVRRRQENPHQANPTPDPSRGPCDASDTVSPTPGPKSTTWSDKIAKGSSGSSQYPGVSTGWPESLLFTFYLENLLPFLFPFYRPSPLQGGRAWIPDMLMSSPVFRQAAFCQTTYFYSLALGTAGCDLAWDRVFEQTKEAYEILRESLRTFSESGLKDRLSEAVRVLAGIMQLLCYDSALSGVANTSGHLQGAVTLLQQILSTAAPDQDSFDSVMDRLDWSPWILPAQCVQVLSADQEVMRFSTALVTFFDIIASTARQEQPKLYEHRHPLLGHDTSRPRIELDKVFGCENWVLLQISEIAALAAWKRQCKTAGNLDYMKLVHRATAIKDALESRSATLDASSTTEFEKDKPVLDLFALSYSQPTDTSIISSKLVTRVWAHAALVYLAVVVSGFQPASDEIRQHVGCAIKILTQELSPPAMARTLLWPICVIGCLAEPSHEASLRSLIEGLQPPSIFGGLHRALAIMEEVWQDRSAERDISSCFQHQGVLVLLV